MLGVKQPKRRKEILVFRDVWVRLSHTGWGWDTCGCLLLLIGLMSPCVCSSGVVVFSCDNPDVPAELVLNLNRPARIPLDRA